ncbi:hypothetical protein PFAG_02304 [Plasmodium falciparum Santa Lucia]|uniref:Uncharacterized protein n=8 Tax=Plasmodium (Laverania) TaxID=418107 RepID=C0H523_PLAF7|nr:conserved Plasmodium protein, unknown function [Plasmodium falciparum 3D7]XP_019970467.1 hypothetical protein PRSY57_0905100 [Plasmodium reichenowi]ETW43002.1 hypothetical protein PFNF135_02477 [Plasmodium falciparum NF135/5.C10]EUR72305.1 hypothetical protein PFBG_02399 [Plasmodium falciparum 7G8]EUT86434.1 hypothetical protein PFAG_02304 [Plasmodium falciparum Santa Lucia]KAF4330763.1 hypothetical protein CYL21_1139 [Plasmodium falciparum NF54]KNC37063.1 hypothetical protein PFLG_02383 [|eukprot:XP_002808919.1 conserved Plasmodium protein, unknown function [Plasmodium falciparum 3D7]
MSNDQDLKSSFLQDLKEYSTNDDKKFPEVLKNYITQNIEDQNEAERFLKEFNDSYLKEMNLDELELLCSMILKKKNLSAN